MTFRVGQKTVYPPHGIAIVKEIQQMKVDGGLEEYYILKILDNGATVMVPLAKAEAKGMREVIPEEAVQAIFGVLKDHSTPTEKQVWNRRKRECEARINTGDVLEVAAVLRDLALLKADKPLSFGERIMYDQAFDLIVQEVASAQDVDEAVVRNDIEDIFKK